MRQIRGLFVASVVAAMTGFGCQMHGGLAASARVRMPDTVRIMCNLDAWSGLSSPSGDEQIVGPEGTRQYMELLAGTGVQDVLFNVNAKRTTYRSDVWEAMWDGQEDTESNTGHWRVPKEYHDQGYDYPAVAVQACREKGMTPWISIRMNDSHYAPLADHDHSYHSTFWKEHPQWWVAPYRFITWHDRCLDYGQKEVRDHYMALIKEVLTRYDMDGLELDFMRFMRYFRPGQMREGTQILTQFVSKVRRQVKKAEKRWGHEITLGVRVPSRPEIASSLSLDAIAWARIGLIDLVVAQSSWEGSDSDIPVELWKELLAGTGVTLAVGFEDGITPYRPARPRTSPEFDTALALAAVHRGADVVYLMNHHDGSHISPDRETYRQLLIDLGSVKALRHRERHHMVTQAFSWPVTDGLAPATSLPYTGRWGIFRLYTGPRPTAKQSTTIRLGIQDHRKPARVYLNGTLCSWERTDEKWEIYAVASQAVKEGYNVIEVAADEQVTPNAVADPVEPREPKKELTITWVEIRIK